MIKVEVKNGKCAVKLDGNFKELCTDSIYVIRGMYLAFAHEDSEVADKFKNHIIENIDSAFAKKDTKKEVVLDAKPENLIKALDKMLEDLMSAINESDD